MQAEKKRPPGWTETGTDTGTGFQRGYYTTSARKPQEENAPVREMAVPGQADRGADYPSLRRSLCRYPTTTAGGRQDKNARYGTNGAFQAVKDAVTVPDAAMLYGFPPNRAGFIRCPFHGGGNEKTPSCHLKERFFKCFACQEGGDVVKFTAKLFSISPLDAVKKLNTDFSVGLTLDGHKATPEELAEARKRQEARKARRLFEDWRERALSALARRIGVGWGALQDGPPWTEAQVTAIKQWAYWDYLSERLSVGDEAEQLEILRDWPNVGTRLEAVLTAKEAVCA